MQRWFEDRDAELAGLPIGTLPPAAPACAQPPALDAALVERMSATHAPLLLKLIETYLGYAPKALTQVEEHARAGNAAGLRMAAHSLKSSSANVGAIPLSDRCRELEARLKADGAVVDAAAAAISRDIRAEFDRAESALRDLRARLSGAPAMVRNTG